MHQRSRGGICCRIIRHRAKSLRHHLKKISQRRLSQAVGVIRRRALKSALHNHSIAIAQPGMAGSAINVKALAATIQHFLGDRKRHVVARVFPNFSGVEISVLIELAAGHRAFNRRTRRAQVGIEITFGQRLEPRLVVHILAATGQGQNTQQS